MSIAGEQRASGGYKCLCTLTGHGVAAVVYYLLARDPYSVDGRLAVASKYMGGQHVLRRWQFCQHRVCRV